MAIFASLVAPFGGFFASGFKRAFNIKDFGASIPGHGGLTDRMDCQFLMGLFTYVYALAAPPSEFLKKNAQTDIFNSPDILDTTLRLYEIHTLPFPPSSLPSQQP